MIYFGIDIGKFNHQAIAIDEKGNPLCASFPFSNSHEGFKLFIKSAMTFMGKDTICIGMEATGHYWLNLYFTLLDLGMELHVVNPIQTDAMRNMNIRKTKTDSVDCIYIAQVIRMGNYSDVAIGDEDVSELRQLCRYRFHLVDTIGAVKNQVVGLLDRVFPEFSSLFSNVFGVTSIEILKKYTTPEQILAVKTITLVNLLTKASRGRFKEAKAKEIKETAKISVGLKSANTAFVFQLRQMILQIEFSENQITELEQKSVNITTSVNAFCQQLMVSAKHLELLFIRKLVIFRGLTALRSLLLLLGLIRPLNSLVILLALITLCPSVVLFT